MKLTVKSARPDDVYKDIVRIHRSDRNSIRAGRVCRISVGVSYRYFIVRGLAQDESGQILVDDISREALGLKLGQQYDFGIAPAGLIGQIRWACAVADPGARIAALLGVLSLVLGLIGVLLGILALWPTQTPRNAISTYRNDGRALGAAASTPGDGGAAKRAP